MIRRWSAITRCRIASGEAKTGNEDYPHRIFRRNFLCLPDAGVCPAGAPSIHAQDRALDQRCSPPGRAGDSAGTHQGGSTRERFWRGDGVLRNTMAMAFTH